MTYLLQAAAVAADSHGKELIAAGATFLLVAAQWITAHLKGRNRERTLGDQLDRKLKPINEGIQEIALECRDLRAIVVGVDGQNGLRSDVRKLTERADDADTRERERLERKVYDRRAST